MKPENVRIRRGDGTEVPCELVHLGVIDGCDTWEIANAVYHVNVDAVLIGVLPPHTAVQFASDVRVIE
jgi:hypothetical protein